MKTIKITSLDRIEEAAAEFAKEFEKHRVIAFHGKMGAGKTTFIKALCNHLKVVDNVTSPTFALINEYRTESEDVVFHFDFYRIENIEEAMDLGYEDYFYSNNLCFIEWPEKVESLMPETYLKAEIVEVEDGSREVLITE